MAHEYVARIAWSAGEEGFTSGRFSRVHRWSFDGGIEIPASASPHVVRLPFSSEEAVDPEEAFVAAIASCHMLTFLYLAAQRKWSVRRYEDDARGIMEKNAAGRMAVTRVTLRPQIEFEGEVPDRAALEAVHEAAHEQCFIANSVTTRIVVEID